MKALSNLFSSAAKTETLCVLCHQPGGVGLRQLARIAGIRVRSAELALGSLVDAGLVSRTRLANRVLFEIDRADPRTAVLSEVFNAAALATIRMESRSLDKRARSVLPFIQQANRMLKHARGSGHDA